MQSINNLGKILITGGEGFLGKRLVLAFKDLNIKTESYDIVSGEDINDYEMLKNKCLKFEPHILIHLAAVADLNFYRDNPTRGDKINIEGTQNVLNICNELKIRLLFASTCCIYGNNDVHPSDETSVVAPTEHYSKSKQAGEKIILNANFHKHTIMRFATFYGPEMRKELAPAIFLTKAHFGEKIEIHGSGKQTRTFTYIDDIVSGIVVIATTDFKYDIINVTSEEATSVLEIAQISKELTGNNVESVFIEDRIGQIFKEEILNARLRSLGWEPKTDFKEGMRLSYEFFKKNGFKF